MSAVPPADVVIVGAGIVGSAIAYYLSIAEGAAHTVEEAIPQVAAVAAQAHLATADHETRLSKLEELITQWAPLVEASAALVEKAIATPPPPKSGD